MTKETPPTEEPQLAAMPAEPQATETPAAEPPKKTKAELRAEQLAEVEAELDDAFSREVDARRDVISLSSELKDAEQIDPAPPVEATAE